MSTTIADQEVRSYLEQVTQHLAALPEDAREDLLEDLEEHLDEVAAEGEGSLFDRLGPPQDYAVELCLAAGLPVPGELGVWQRLHTRFSRSSIGKAVGSLSESKMMRGVRQMWPELRPGWWVLRGYVATTLLAHALTDQSSRSPFSPTVGGNFLLGAIFVAAGIAASVWLGRRSRSGGLKLIGLAASVAVILMMVGAVSERDVVHASSYPDYVTYLDHEDGEAIFNICAYTSTGEPLEDVLLFDHAGRPIDNTAHPDQYGYYEYDGYSGYSGREEPSPLAADGTQGVLREGELEPTRFANSYPRPRAYRDPTTDQLVPFSCPDVVVSTERSVTPEEE